MLSSKLAIISRQLKIFVISWLLHLFLEEARAEINVWQKSRTVLTAEIEIELLAELSCALKYALETRWLQVREFILSLFLLKTPQMPQGLEYMEEEFAKDYNNNSIGRIRLAICFGTICYMIFGLLDPISLPTNYIFVWILRYGLISIFLMILGCTYTDSGKKHIQLLSLLCSLLPGFGIIGMIGVSVKGEIGYEHYYAGVTLVILWANAAIRLRFINFAFCSSLLLVAYWAVALIYQDVVHSEITWKYFLSSNFFLIGSITVGLVASFSMEMQARLEFLARNIIVPGAIQEFHRYCEVLTPIDHRQLQDFLNQNPKPQNLEILVNRYKKFFLK